MRTRRSPRNQDRLYGAMSREADAALIRMRQEMHGLLCDVAAAGVAFDDPHLSYVEVQVDRETWNRLAPYRRKEESNDLPTMPR